MEDDITENVDVIIRSRTNSDSGISSNESNIESQAPQISGPLNIVIIDKCLKLIHIYCKTINY